MSELIETLYATAKALEEQAKDREWESYYEVVKKKGEFHPPPNCYPFGGDDFGGVMSNKTRHEFYLRMFKMMMKDIAELQKGKP